MFFFLCSFHRCAAAPECDWPLNSGDGDVPTADSLLIPTSRQSACSSCPPSSRRHLLSPEVEEQLRRPRGLAYRGAVPFGLCPLDRGSYSVTEGGAPLDSSTSDRDVEVGSPRINESPRWGQSTEVHLQVYHGHLRKRTRTLPPKA
ncbi:hypothetical protein C8Q77DRAFT_661338 [Trametes polyzona]|nr:hypothetical protein C8Q77DRAFT_661338 [Trametes polyzona]